MFINAYVDLVMSNPMIPGFLFLEMQRDEEWLVNLFKNQSLNIARLQNQINKEIEEKKIKPFKLEDLYANIIGMTVFPLLGKPIFMELIFIIPPVFIFITKI